MFYSSKIGVAIEPPSVGMYDYTFLDSELSGYRHGRRCRLSSPSNELESNVEQHSNLMVKFCVDLFVDQKK